MSDQAATKQDLLDLEARMKDDLGQLRQDLTTALHETETRILKAIFGLVESANKRLSAVEQLGAGLMNRISTLEARLLEVEKRLHIPPAA